MFQHGRERFVLKVTSLVRRRHRYHLVKLWIKWKATEKDIAMSLNESQISMTFLHHFSLKIKKKGDPCYIVHKSINTTHPTHPYPGAGLYIGERLPGGEEHTNLFLCHLVGSHCRQDLLQAD
jgi:hypothetical protein